LAIVTNQHVIENSVTGRFFISQGNQYNEPILGQGINVEFDKFSEKWVQHPDKKTDLTITPFRPVITECRKHGKVPFFTRIQYNTIEDVSQWRAGSDHVRLLGIARKRLYVAKNGEVVTQTIDLGVAIRSTNLEILNLSWQIHLNGMCR
jgi:hypothetical protein